MVGAVLVKRAARKAFDAMNRKDIDEFMRPFAEEAVFEFPGRHRLAGRFEGKSEIEAWFRTWWETVPSLRFSVKHVAVERIFALNATNAVTVEWELAEHDRDGRSYRLSGITALEVKGGKVGSCSGLHLRHGSPR